MSPSTASTDYRRTTPPVNASLTSIGTYTVTDDSGGGGTRGTAVPRWTGSSPAFVSEKVDFGTEVGGGLSRAFVATLILPSDLNVQPGEQVTWIHNGTEQTRGVDSTESRDDFGFTRCFITSRGEES